MTGWINKLMNKWANMNEQKNSVKIRMNKSMKILQSNEWTNKNGWINKLIHWTEIHWKQEWIKDSVNKLINKNTEID